MNNRKPAGCLQPDHGRSSAGQAQAGVHKRPPAGHRQPRLRAQPQDKRRLGPDVDREKEVHPAQQQRARELREHTQVLGAQVLGPGAPLQQRQAPRQRLRQEEVLPQLVQLHQDESRVHRAVGEVSKLLLVATPFLELCNVVL